MKKQEIINNVSKQIESLVKYEVGLLADTPFKEKYENLVEEIEYMVDEARSLVDNFKEERLSRG
jgi:hypothetical protein